jgi:CRISPR-associated endonuclease/helicase Cas3
VASAFHDIGKADYRFQGYLLGNENRVFHPLLGLPLVNRIAESFEQNLRSLIVFAVASHHTPLHQDLYSEVGDEQTLQVIDKDHLRSIVLTLANRIGIELNEIDSCLDDSCRHVFLEAKHNFDYNSHDEAITLREQFIKIQGILNYADWFASGSKDISSIHFSKDFIKKPYQYQQIASITKGNVFITLPTGSGKTETALCWISANLDEAFRVFYTLPTVTTINAMYQRLSDKSRYGLSDEVVSEYFNNVDLYLQLEGANPKRSNLHLYRNFFYPMNVTTPDQLILALMNHRKYTLKSFLMQKSLVVFDEIHAYDAETFGLIKSLIRHFHDYYESKFCIMSATFPNVLKAELSFLNSRELVSREILESEYRSRRRTRVEFTNSTVIQNLDKIWNQYLAGYKILIVMNTVGRAQNVFRALYDILEQNNFALNDLMLIHSRFTFFDKRNLERRIFEYPRILVATQVIEVSLDIDYDVMFTEACYLDSLVQRAGRINRKGKLGNEGQGIVVVCVPEGWNNRTSSLPYDYEMLSDSIAIIEEEANNITSELDYVTLTNLFYDQSWQSSQEAEERFEEIWNRVHYVYRANLSEEGMMDLLRTRSGILTVNSYSRTHWEQIYELDERLCATENIEERSNIYAQIRMLSINVPVIKSVRFTPRQGHGDFEYMIVEADYDRNLGLLTDL